MAGTRGGAIIATGVATRQKARCDLSDLLDAWLRVDNSQPEELDAVEQAIAAAEAEAGMRAEVAERAREHESIAARYNRWWSDPVAWLDWRWLRRGWGPVSGRIPVYPASDSSWGTRSSFLLRTRMTTVGPDLWRSQGRSTGRRAPRPALNRFERDVTTVLWDHELAPLVDLAARPQRRIGESAPGATLGIM